MTRARPNYDPATKALAAYISGMGDSLHQSGNDHCQYAGPWGVTSLFVTCECGREKLSFDASDWAGSDLRFQRFRRMAENARDVVNGPVDVRPDWERI